MSATKKFAYLSDLHYEHRLWRNQLAFYKDEIGILEERLKEIISKNTNNEVGAKVESFQNRFDLTRDHISDIKHAIKKEEKLLTDYTQEHPIAIDHVHFQDHVVVRDKMDTFTDVYHEMKKEFNQFAVKWM